MQNSDVSGGKNDAARVVRSSGTLLMRNDRSMVVDCVRSDRDVAFAKTSKEPRMRSIAVDCTSPYVNQHLLSVPGGSTYLIPIV